MPLRPIVSGIGSVTEGCAKHLAQILNAVKGKNSHAIKDSHDFVKKIQHLVIPADHHLVSFDVSALFTSIPIDYAVEAVRKKLTADNSWRDLTELNLEQVLQLLELCLSTTYFMYGGQFFRQKFGAPMGSPISPGVADLSMEIFEEEALSVCPQSIKPLVWYRYVDDTFTVLKKDSVEDFTTFLNSRNEHIQFTRETEEENKLAFLDTCVHHLPSGHIKTTVYRKPTHTDQYLNWDSNHHLDHKRSVVRTLLNRADTHITEAEDKVKEVEHVKTVLKANGYKHWALNIPNQKNKDLREKKKREQGTSATPQPPLGLPYIQGLSEELQRVFKKHDINIYHKPGNTLRSFLVKPKDPTPTVNKCGVVYNINCNSCDDSYIGETARSLGQRFQEHQTHDQSAIKEHLSASGHSVSLDDVRILTSEARLDARKVKEAIEIYKRRPSLNRDQGVEIPPILLQLVNRLPNYNKETGGGPGARHRTGSL